MTTLTYIIIIILAIIIIAAVIYFLLRPKRKLDASLEYTTALNYLILGDKKKALNKLRDAVRHDTGNIDAYLKIGDILRDQGLADRAIKIHRGLTVRRNLSVSQKMDILKSLIKDYSVIEKYDRAIQVANSLVELTHNEIWSQKVRLKLYEESGDWEKALDAQKTLQKAKGEKDDKLLALYKVEAGLKFIEDGAERDGRLKFREAIKLDKFCPPAYLYLSDSYILENRYDDALSELKKFITKAPELAYLAFNRFKEILFHLGNFGEIENIFRSLHEKNPDNESVRLAIADIYERKGELEKAIDLCYSGLEKNPDSHHAKHSLAKYLVRVGRKEEALKYALDLAEALCDFKEDHFTCKICGYESEQPKWRCPDCFEWNSFLS